MRVIAIEEHFMTPDGFAITERNGKGGKPITDAACPERLDPRVADGKPGPVTV